MNNFFKKLFGNTPPEPLKAMPTEFAAYAREAVGLLAESNAQLDDEEVVKLFCANSIPHEEAVELLLFLPSAFCRYMLPQLDWPAYYVEYISEQKQRQIAYAANPRFLVIQEAMKTYLAGEFRQEDFLKIAGRSATFHAINELLLDGGKLEDVAVTPEYVVR